MCSQRVKLAANLRAGARGIAEGSSEELTLETGWEGAVSVDLMMKTGAQIPWECLEREGVTHVFGYPGGAILPAYDALKHSE